MGEWMRLLCRLLLGCDHADRFRERRGGVLYLVCWRCGHAVPALSRTKAEARRVARVRPAHEGMKAQPARPATILPMRTRSR